MRSRGGTQRSRGQGGQSLIELLVAIVLIGIIFVAIVSAIFTVLRSTATNKRIQAIDTALVSYGEIVRDRTLVPYSACTATGASGSATVAAAYETAAAQPGATSTAGVAGATDRWRKPDGMIVTVTGVDAWNLSTAKFATTGCAVPDGGAQRVSYTITLQNVTRSGQTVKRVPGPS